MASLRSISRRQKTLRGAYPEKKVVQLQTNQGELSIYPIQTKVKSRGEIRSSL